MTRIQGLSHYRQDHSAVTGEGSSNIDFCTKYEIAEGQGQMAFCPMEWALGNQTSYLAFDLFPAFT